MEFLSYDNFFNSLSFTDFNAFDIDLFIFILGELQYTDEVFFTAQELRKALDYKYHCSNIEFADLVLDTQRKLLKMDMRLYNGSLKWQLNLFDSCYYDDELEKFMFRRSHYTKALIGKLYRKYTTISIPTLISLKGVYSKRLYMLLSQYKDTGFYYVRIAELRKCLDVPEGYATRDLGQKILKKAVEELKEIWPGLGYNSRHRGGSKTITSYRFYFNGNSEEPV